MFKTILKIFGFLFSAFGNPTDRRLKEDKELANAIRKGDGKTVGKIRERRKKYPKLFLVLMFVFLTSCMSHRDVPLTEGAEPYALPPGLYTDVHGEVHNEAKQRWSLSEADLYRSTQQIGKKKVQTKDIILFVLIGSLLVIVLVKKK